VTGEIAYDNQPINPAVPLWERCALVEAQDEQYRDISVKDAITYAMMLRCPLRSLFNIARSNVDRTVALLHLEDIAHKKCKSISKGQRRRVSIAEEIVGGPSLLLIDEPTTDIHDDSYAGHDSAGTAIEDESIMMQCFRELVNQDRTVVCAMHKPNERVFHLFDTVLLLAKGQVVYFGDVSDAVKYFTSLPNPFHLPQFKNPADFLTDISGGYAATVTVSIRLHWR
jgi:ABC-type multidrug transport system ATPase subunit